jgi:hypothetical protein
MNMRNQNTQTGGFDVLRTPSGAVDFDAYQLRGRREQARAVKAAFTWLNDRFVRSRKS